MRIAHRAKGLIATAAALLVAACATPTPYQPLGAQGTGDSLTSRERVETYLLYRAAELTLEQGYDSFTIVDRATDRNVETRVYRDPFGPGPYRWWRPYWRYRGSFGWRTWDPWFGDPFWADSIDVSTIQRFEANAEIVMSHGRRANDTKSFDAHEVIANLGPSIEAPREGRGG